MRRLLIVVAVVLLLPSTVAAMPSGESSDRIFALGQVDGWILEEITSGDALRVPWTADEFESPDWQENQTHQVLTVRDIDVRIRFLESGSIPAELLTLIQNGSAKHLVNAEACRVAIDDGSFAGFRDCQPGMNATTASLRVLRESIAKAVVAAGGTEPASKPPTNPSARPDSPQATQAARESLETQAASVSATETATVVTNPTSTQLPPTVTTIPSTATAIPPTAIPPTETPNPADTPVAIPTGGPIGDGLYVISGTFILIDPRAEWRAGRPCAGDGGYSDIGQGADVEVRNGDGSIVGVDRIGPGVGVTSSACEFRFTVEVSEERFYTVDISSRGGISYSFDDLVGTNWVVTLSLGSFS